jgi:hypothetical protein
MILYLYLTLRNHQTIESELHSYSSIWEKEDMICNSALTNFYLEFFRNAMLHFFAQSIIEIAVVLSFRYVAELLTSKTG